MIKSNIIGVQQVKKELEKAIKELSPDKHVLVGLNEGLGKHPGSDLTIPTIGAIQQFGAPNIPARPWLDTGVAKAENDINKIIEKTYEEDDPDVERMLNLIGIAAVNAVQLNIEEIKSPPNAKSTIEKKGSSNPLIGGGYKGGISGGTMRQSVTYILTREKPQEGI